MFITLEGPEGSGKTSHLPHLVEYLREQGYTVFPTREPGGTLIGEQIREVIHNLKNVEMHPRTETLLYQAARAQIVEQVIIQGRIRPPRDSRALWPEKTAPPLYAVRPSWFRAFFSRVKIAICPRIRGIFEFHPFRDAGLLRDRIPGPGSLEHEAGLRPVADRGRCPVLHGL